MDWSNVTVEELGDALREVDWSAPPRPLAEFFQRFTSPKNITKWSSRLKCNFYYYRTNYFGIFILVMSFAFIRNPAAFIAVIVSGLSLLCLNDSFATAISERITKAIRQVNPPLAAKLRPPVVRGTARGRGGKSSVYIAGQDRKIVVGVLLLVSSFLWYWSSAVVTTFGGFFISTLLVVLHASFRSPNLKARLNTYREEFRAVWRGYSDVP